MAIVVGVIVVVDVAICVIIAIICSYCCSNTAVVIDMLRNTLVSDIN